MDNVEIFSAGLAVDAVTAGSIRILAAGSCHSSCFAAMSTPLAFVWDLGGSQSCVGGSWKEF